MATFTVETEQADQVIPVTDQVQSVVEEAGLATGVAVVHIAHTTAALSTADLDPGTDQDMLDAFRAMVPTHGDIGYRHPHDPEHTPDHILSTLIGTDVTIPVEQGRLRLGTWQEIVVFEFDGPRERTIVVTPCVALT